MTSCSSSRDTDRPTRAWVQASVLVFLVVVQACIAFRVARSVHSMGDYDPSAYYAMAVNFANGRGLVDDCLWHCLGPSPTVERPAGDYWPPGWPVLLGLGMRLAGTSFESTAYMMATLSLLLPLGVVALLRSWDQPWSTAWIGGMLVCLQTPQQLANILPDVMLSYALTCLGGLVLFSWILRAPTRWRLVLTGAVCMLPVWLRGEGFILWLAGALALLGRQRECASEGGSPPSFPHESDGVGGRNKCRPSPDSLRLLPWWTAGGLIGLLSHLAYNLHAFHHLTPLPRGALPWLTDAHDLYYWQPLPGFERWWAQGPLVIGRHILSAFMMQCRNLVSGDIPLPLTSFALAGAWRLWRSDAGARAAIYFVGFSFSLPPLAYPIVVNYLRFQYIALVFFCVLAPPALTALCGRWPRARAALVTVGCLACGYFVLWPWPWGMMSPIRGWSRPDAAPPAIANRLKPRDVVMTSDPWIVTSTLGVASVVCPDNGPQAVYASIATYRPHFLLAHQDDPVDYFLRQTGEKGLHVKMRLNTASGEWIELCYP